MLQVMLVFYSKSGRLHRSCRELILNILQAEDEVKAHYATGFGIPAEQFRVEAVKAISNLSTDWGKRNEAYLKGGANYLLRYLTSIAMNVSDLQMFTQFQHEAEKIIARFGLWLLGQRLHPLETISSKVSDLRTFNVVFQDIVPVHGLETTASLLGVCKDFQEFEVYYPRIQEQLRWWQSGFTVLFIRAKNTSGLDRLLSFLETLAKQGRITKYIRYTEVHNSGTLFTCISGALHTYKAKIFNMCLERDWTRETEYDQLINEMVDGFETTILDTYLTTIWYSSLQFHMIRWEFTKFTDSIPYGIISWEWTQDNAKTRAYWNWTYAAGREHDRYIKTLEPLLLPLLRILEFSEIEALFDLLPQYIGIEEFKTTVKVPVEWEKGTEYQEAYNKWAGHYTEEVAIARPKSFVDHTFTFARPDLQNAITFLNSIDKVHEAIQAYNKS